jgi:hypothetical protein
MLATLGSSSGFCIDLFSNGFVDFAKPIKRRLVSNMTMLPTGKTKIKKSALCRSPEQGENFNQTARADRCQRQGEKVNASDDNRKLRLQPNQASARQWSQ